MKYSYLPFLIVFVLVLFCKTPLFASSSCTQKSCCKWNAKLSQAFDKYEKYINGQYETDDADILLPLGNRDMNCVLDSIVKKEKYDFNLHHLLWMTFVPDSVFFLSPANLKYLVENKNVWLKNDYDTWLAHYTDKTNYSGDYILWQFTNDGIIDGIDGYVDLDIYYKE